jgi:hypothetical protein
MSRKVHSSFVTNLIRRVELQQQTATDLQEKILEYLKLHDSEWVRDWDLCDILIEQLIVPESLHQIFKDDYEKTLFRMDSDEVIRKTWFACCGGVIMYPRDAGDKAVTAQARANGARVKLAQSVQYGDEEDF